MKIPYIVIVLQRGGKNQNQFQKLCRLFILPPFLPSSPFSLYLDHFCRSFYTLFLFVCVFLLAMSILNQFNWLFRVKQQTKVQLIILLQANGNRSAKWNYLLDLFLNCNCVHMSLNANARDYTSASTNERGCKYLLVCMSVFFVVLSDDHSS